jgi:hypothetical protein
MRLVTAIVGVLLIIVGLLAFAGVGLTTNKAKVELGPLQATVKEERSLPPAVAGAAIVLGVVLLAVGARKSR